MEKRQTQHHRPGLHQPITPVGAEAAALEAYAMDWQQLQQQQRHVTVWPEVIMSNEYPLCLNAHSHAGFYE